MISIKNNTLEVVKVEISDVVYDLPLVKNLPYKLVKKLAALQDTKDVDTLIEILSAYIPVDVLEELSIANLSTIMTAWSGASKEDAETMGN